MPTAEQTGQPKYEAKKARQGTGPRAMFWVLVISMTLAVIAGLIVAAPYLAEGF